MARQKKENNMLNISTPNRLSDKENMRDLLKHLPAPMILLGEFNAHYG